MAGVRVGCRIHWAGVMGTSLGGGLSCVTFAGTMVTLGVNAGGVSVGTLGDGAVQLVWSVPAGASSWSDGGDHLGVGYFAPLRDS